MWKHKWCLQMCYVPYMTVSRVTVVDLGCHEETLYWDWELSVGGAGAWGLGVLRGRAAPWPLAKKVRCGPAQVWTFSASVGLDLTLLVSR